jgi:hypothetical protein
MAGYTSESCLCSELESGRRRSAFLTGYLTLGTLKFESPDINSGVLFLDHQVSKYGP